MPYGGGDKGVNDAACPPEGGPAEAFRPHVCHGALTVRHGCQTVRWTVSENAPNPPPLFSLALDSFGLVRVYGISIIVGYFMPYSIYHHHHVVLVARISLTLSHHSSLSFIALGRSSGQYPVSSHSCWMYVRAGRPAFAGPCVGVHKSTSLMSSSLLLQ